jgi:molybdopterin synthase catalytic subunit
MAIDMIQIQTETFDAGDLTRQLTAGTTAHGAVVSFVGLVRDQAEHPVSALLLEHYSGMTEKALTAIVAEARTRWVLGPITVVHRVGTLLPGEPIVFVGVTSAHRKQAFEACEFLIDYLKIKAPLWKKETSPQGERWVASRASDCEAAQRWR